MDASIGVVLLSGGLDSATVLAIARRAGFRCIALTLDYGQRHRSEIEAARRVAAAHGVQEHMVLPLDLRALGGSALTADIEVPKDRDVEHVGEEIPITYVPARNTIMLAVALGLAEARGCGDLFIGVNAVDYSGYPDCRRAYIDAFETMANLATRAGIEGQRITVHAPLIDLTKAQIIRRGLDLDVDYGLTASCYDPRPDGRPCARCDACILRANGFREAGVEDPLELPSE